MSNPGHLPAADPVVVSDSPAVDPEESPESVAGELAAVVPVADESVAGALVEVAGKLVAVASVAGELPAVVPVDDPSVTGEPVEVGAPDEPGPSDPDEADPAVDSEENGLDEDPSV